MTAYAKVEGCHKTTTADTVDTCELSKAADYVVLKNRSGTYALSYTLPRKISANPDLNPTDPTYLGDNTHHLGAGESVVLEGYDEGTHIEVIGETGQTVAWSFEAF